MSRRGFEKVRTGCKTCKIRKIKCDETWPQCLRCQKTGRTCSGYQAPPAGSLSWNLLLRTQPSVTPVCDNAERRSLAYFHQVVAPVLSGPLDPSFWTHFVAQATHHEPTARHAVLAISSLFENFSETTLKTTDDPFALRHYNKAINGLLTNPGQDIDTILTVCVLFICIEFLRGDDKAAVDHTRHGVKLLNERGGSSQLAAVFCHINLFPLFFGTAVDDVPLLITNVSMPHGPFKSMHEAKHHLDIMMVRTVWLVRRSEHWQIGVAENGCPTPDMFEEQRVLITMFTRWGHSFARYQASEGIETNSDSASLALKIRWLTSSIWVRNCLTRGESAYDKYRSGAESVVEMARNALALSAKSSAGRPKKFMFDMGFSPILHFVVLKCRYLDLRLQALALLKGLACRRESLWDAISMQAVCRKIIEVEHGIELGPDATERADDFANVALPAEMDRVRGYNLEDAHLFRSKERTKVHHRPVCLFMHGENGGVALRREMITIYT